MLLFRRSNRHSFAEWSTSLNIHCFNRYLVSFVQIGFKFYQRVFVCLGVLITFQNILQNAHDIRYRASFHCINRSFPDSTNKLKIDQQKKKKKRKKRKKDRKGGNKWTANSSANSELLGYRDTGLTAGSFRAETACLRAETYRRATCELVYPIGFLAALCRFSVHASRPMTHARIRLPHRSCICVSLTGRRNECRVRATADCNRLWSPSVFCGLGQCHALAAAS